MHGLAKQKTIKERALLLSAKTLLLEQAKRIEQAHGELDGRMWSLKTGQIRRIRLKKDYLGLRLVLFSHFLLFDRSRS